MMNSRISRWRSVRTPRVSSRTRVSEPIVLASVSNSGTEHTYGTEQMCRVKFKCRSGSAFVCGDGVAALEDVLGVEAEPADGGVVGHAGGGEVLIALEAPQGLARGGVELAGLGGVVEDALVGEL